MRSKKIAVLFLSLVVVIVLADIPSVLASPNDLAASKPGRCLLVVDGKTYISGACKVEIDSGGSFRIYENRKQGYFAYVNLSSDGAQGYWNETRSSTHAHADLGTLTRDGACWRNEHAKVCAWR